MKNVLVPNTDNLPSRDRKGAVGPGKRRPKKILAASAALLTSCQRAPAIDVEGSFFPAWIICLAISVFLTFGIRYILLRLRMESEVGPLVVFYPSLLTLLTIVLWMGYYR
jgi:hypothetical protein